MAGLVERRPTASKRTRGELQYYRIQIAFLSAVAAFLLIEPLYKSCCRST